MTDIQPIVSLISEPSVDAQAMRTYLKDIGGEVWWSRVVAANQLDQGKVGAEPLIEFCGRLCYKSWAPGLNRNVTKVRTDSAEYLTNILTVRHGSLIEHAHFSFLFQNVSRVCVEELKRHRHANISEQSFRYVRIVDIPFRMPPGLPEEVVIAGKGVIERIEQFLAWANECCGLDNEGDETQVFKKPIHFEQKKQITSALRRFVPQGIATDLVWTANLRTIRHCIELRTEEGAEEEIRFLFNQVGEIMSEKAPFFFSDYELYYGKDLSVPVWMTKNRKV